MNLVCLHSLQHANDSPAASEASAKKETAAVTDSVDMEATRECIYIYFCS